jgi:hypothetical protein
MHYCVTAVTTKYLADRLITEHSCSRHGMVAARLTYKRPTGLYLFQRGTLGPIHTYHAVPMLELGVVAARVIS